VGQAAKPKLPQKSASRQQKRRPAPAAEPRLVDDEARPSSFSITLVDRVLSTLRSIRRLTLGLRSTSASNAETALAGQ